MGPQAKKRKVASKVEEISFDAADRQEFLTGFRKRKQQRIKHAQDVAEKKARELKRESRKRMREERTAEFQQALEEHRRQLKRLKDEDSDNENSSSGSGNDEGDDQEWEGFEEPPAVDYEAEYIDEDKYTTVTVEEMDPSKEGLLRSVGEDDEAEEEERNEATPASDTSSKPTGEKSKRKTDTKPKKKKKKFRYESKEERKLTRAKERMSNQRKAKARRERS